MDDTCNWYRPRASVGLSTVVFEQSVLYNFSSIRSTDNTVQGMHAIACDDVYELSIAAHLECIR